MRVNAANPILEFGKADGEDAYLFEDIVAMVVNRERGELYVADAGRREVLVYGINDGRFRRGLGRRGSGPGEFEGIANLFIVDGSAIGVWDPDLQRVTLFAPSGNVLRTITLPNAGPLGSPVGGVLGQTARHIGWTGAGYVLEARPNPLRVARADQFASLVRLDSMLTTRDTLLRLRVPTIAASQRTNGGGTVTSYEAPPLLGPEPVLSVGPDGTIAIAPGGPYQIVVLEARTTEQPRSFEAEERVQAITVADRMALLEFAARRPENGFPSNRSVAEFERTVRDRFSLYRPAITGLLWDSSARLWVRRFDTAFSPDGRGGDWDVVNLPGRRIERSVRFSTGIVPMLVDERRVYCTRTDSLGVKHVLVLPYPSIGSTP